MFSKTVDIPRICKRCLLIHGYYRVHFCMSSLYFQGRVHIWGCSKGCYTGCDADVSHSGVIEYPSSGRLRRQSGIAQDRSVVICGFCTEMGMLHRKSSWVKWYRCQISKTDDWVINF